MKQHYTITVPEREDEGVWKDEYTDGIMAESKEEAVRLFSECLNLAEFTKEEIAGFVTEI